MKQNFKRIIAMGLVLVSILTLFAGCGEKEIVVDVPELIPEKQIMSDKYDRNDDITNMVKFTMDYTKTKRDDGKTSINEKITTYALSEHFGVQIDNWDSIIVGIDTMGDITAEIDARNKQYVEEQTEALIAARQKAIDEAYEAAKKEAEENGKTYTKEKKSVRTDDIHFDSPYTYTLAIGSDSKKKAEPYQETLLIDPAKNSKLVLNVSKYGIPYVSLTFAKVGNLYNLKITQESDWIVTAIQAADVSGYMYEKVDGKNQLKETMPEFIDIDGLNKAAKQNMFMNGDVSFGGGSFNWDSLMKFCKALGLVEGSKKHGFSQSSDKQFTYYTLYFAANPFEKENVNIYDESIVIPWIKLVATFDPLSQICVNWTIDMSTSPTVLNKKVHTLSNQYEVNVKDYQVDTNNYEGMRQKIADWIDANKSGYKVVYCAQESNAENNSIFGIVETGNQNTAVEIVIDGKTYMAISGGEWSQGGCFGYYIDVEKLIEADAAADDNERNKIIDKNKKALTIGCYVVDASNNIVCAFNSSVNAFADLNGMPMYLASYEETDNGYKNAKILDADTADQLILLYAKTYQLDEAQTAAMYDKFSTGGLPGIKKYIDDLFAEAEAAQKAKEENMSGSNENTSASKVEQNTSADLSQIEYNGKSYTLDTINTTVFTDIFKTKQIYSYISNLVNINGISYDREDGDEVRFVTDENNGRNYVFGTNAQEITFLDGIRVGMSSSELKQVAGAAYDSTAQVAILKSKTHTLIVTVKDDVANCVFLIDNEYYSTTIEMDIAPIIMDELHKVDCLVETTEKNTDVDLSNISIDMVDYNFLQMNKKTLLDAGYKSQVANTFAHVDGDYMSIAGYAFVNKAKATIYTLLYNDRLQFIYASNVNDVNQPNYEFYNGITIGLSKRDMVGLLPDNYYVNEDETRYILKNDDLTLIISCDDVVQYVALIKNDTYVTTTNN